MSSTPITWERTGSIGILSLTGSRGNYLADPEFVPADELQEHFDEPDLTGIIIRGSGRHFSAGADLEKLKRLVSRETDLMLKMNAGKHLIRLIERVPLPVVAEITGACFGGGLEIALACHIRICSDNSLFAFPEVHQGIIPGLGGTVSLPGIIGTGKATEMILSGDVIPGEKALEIGLVDYIFPVNRLHDSTVAYLKKLTAGRDTEVIRSIMQSIYNSRVMDTDQALQEETRLFCKLAVRNIRGNGVSE
jgi:enoyl-CoA hydratase